jgi:hypothetical protein
MIDLLGWKTVNEFRQDMPGDETKMRMMRTFSADEFIDHIDGTSNQTQCSRSGECSHARIRRVACGRCRRSRQRFLG